MSRLKFRRLRNEFNSFPVTDLPIPTRTEEDESTTRTCVGSVFDIRFLHDYPFYAPHVSFRAHHVLHTVCYKQFLARLHPDNRMALSCVYMHRPGLRNYTCMIPSHMGWPCCQSVTCSRNWDVRMGMRHVVAECILTYEYWLYSRGLQGRTVQRLFPMLGMDCIEHIVQML